MKDYKEFKEEFEKIVNAPNIMFPNQDMKLESRAYSLEKLCKKMLHYIKQNDIMQNEKGFKHA